MGDVVSLNKFRKAKDKAADKKQASENRVRHGQTKAERKERAALEQLDDTRHNDHVLEDDHTTED